MENWDGWRVVLRLIWDFEFLSLVTLALRNREHFSSIPAINTPTRSSTPPAGEHAAGMLLGDGSCLPRVHRPLSPLAPPPGGGRHPRAPPASFSLAPLLGPASWWCTRVTKHAVSLFAWRKLMIVPARAVIVNQTPLDTIASAFY